jgi:hypothetical protein
MKLTTPWGEIEVAGVVDPAEPCAQCGRCCRGFVLSMRPIDRETWYKRFLKNSPYEYPPDIGAIQHLFKPIPDAFAADGQQIHTCGAFDREKNSCMLMEDGRNIRPIACWAFPFNYDFDSFFDFPYPGCAIFLATLKKLLGRGVESIAEAYDPIREK